MKPTDRTLQRWWRIIVLQEWDNKCAFCGADIKIRPLECHHWLRRGHVITRHDFRNGIPLCADCHRIAHTKLGDQKVLDKLVKKWGGETMNDMAMWENKTIKQECVDRGITRNEYQEECLRILKERKNDN